MPLQKVSMILAVTTAPVNTGDAQPHSGGWTEGHWDQRGKTINDPDIIAMCTKRALLLPAQCSVLGVKLQQYDISGNKLLPGGSTSNKKLYPGNPALTVDVPQASLQMSAGVVSVPNAVRFNIRAIPDECVSLGEYQPTAAFKTNLTAYIATLNGVQTFSTVVRDLTQQSVRVLSIVNGNVTVDNLGGMAVTDYCIFRRVKDTNGNPVSGSFRITAINGLTLTLAGLDPTIIATNNGTCREDHLIVRDYAAISPGRIGVKKIGSPFEKYRGRRSKVRR